MADNASGQPMGVEDLHDDHWRKAPRHRADVLYHKAETYSWHNDTNIISYRAALPAYPRLCSSKSSPAISILEDGLALSATGAPHGYRTIMAAEGFINGCFYFEVLFDEQGSSPESHVRFGIGQSALNLHGPLGMDKYGYAYCDTGHLFHGGVKTNYGKSFGPGDVIGCLVRFPRSIGAKDEVSLSMNPASRSVVKFHGHWICDHVKTIDPAPVQGSTVEFFKNGQSQGVAFSDLPSAIYFPAFSLYCSPLIRVNFGPEFAFPPNALADSAVHPLSHHHTNVILQESLVDLKLALCSSIKP